MDVEGGKEGRKRRAPRRAAVFSSSREKNEDITMLHVIPALSLVPLSTSRASERGHRDFRSAINLNEMPRMADMDPSKHRLIGDGSVEWGHFLYSKIHISRVAIRLIR